MVGNTSSASVSKKGWLNKPDREYQKSLLGSTLVLVGLVVAYCCYYWIMRFIVSGYAQKPYDVLRLPNPIPTSDDIDLYLKYARWTLDGEIPYRDYRPEYPPLAVVFIMLPALLAALVGRLNIEVYTTFFFIQNGLLTIGSLWLIYASLRRVGPGFGVESIRQRLLAFAVGAVSISLYLMQRFDIGAAFLTALAVWLFLSHRPGWSGVVLGLATLAKLYPIVILPVILLYLWYSPRRRSAVSYGLGFGVACLAGLLPFVLSGGTGGLLAFLAYHSERGIQLESVFASLIVFGSHLGLTDALSMTDHGALGLASPWVKPLASLSTGLTVVGLLVIYALAWRRLRSQGQKPSTGWLLQLASLCVLWFVLANKVISPQYMVWLLVLLPFWSGWRKTALFLLALPLSFIPFPFLIDSLARLDLLPFVILSVRNGLLLAIGVMLVRDLWFQPAPPLLVASQPSRGDRPGLNSVSG